MSLLDLGFLVCAVMWLLSVAILIVLVIQEVAYWRREDAVRAASRVRVPAREVCDELGLRRERSRTRGAA
jgi:hypothetical protein